MTHIMWLTNLAPEIQEAVLFLPCVESGPDTVKEIDVRRIARVMDWGVQRGMWLASSFLLTIFQRHCAMLAKTTLKILE